MQTIKSQDREGELVDFEQFMLLFRGAVAAIENGEVAELELCAAPIDEDYPLQVDVTIRRQQYVYRETGPGDEA